MDVKGAITMYTLYRYYYHNLCIQPTNYHIDEHKFDSLIDLRDFVYNTYRNNYIIREKGMDFILTSTDRPVEIHAIVRRDDDVF